MRPFLLLLAAGSGLVLSGCGDLESDNPRTVAPSASQLSSAATVGADGCILCHQGTTPVKSGEWLGSKHANNNAVPDLTYAAQPGAQCAPCHNPLGDGAKLATNVAGQLAAPYNLQPDRPVVGCESCHGGGALHPGNWAIAYPRAAQAKCVFCHYLPGTVDGSFFQGKGAATVTVTLPGHGLQQGDTVYLDITSPATGVPTDGLYTVASVADAATFNVTAAAAAKDVIGAVHVQAPGQNTYAQLGTAVTVTQARHGLTLGQLVALDFTSGQIGGIPADGIYAVMAVPDAHSFTVTAAAGSSSGNVTTADAHTTAAPAVADSVISDSHRDNPLTNTSSNSKATQTDGRFIEGYVVRQGAGGCNDCHNAHSTDLTIQREWAQSAHGGRILTRKLAGLPGAFSGTDVYDATRTTVIQTVPFPGTAWYSNWDQTYQASDLLPAAVGTTPAGDGVFDTVAEARARCQRCHTATGVANFLSGPASYDPNKNDFSHLSGWQFTWLDAARTIPGPTRASDQNELLYCWGCHSDSATGALRNPGAITFTYTNDATTTYPDVAGSNVCIACHSGREIGDSIKLSNGLRDTAPAGTVPGSDFSFISSHYFTGGGTVFGKTGYEFAGRDYTDLPNFKHKAIGISEADTGSNGPCVGCHMSRPESHLFMPVTKDPTTEAITAVNTPVCSTCHFGADMVAVLENAKAGFENAQQVFIDTLLAKGIRYYDGNFYPLTGTLTSANRITNWTTFYGAAKWQDTMGACFNLSLLSHDGGAYLHNRIYTKRLLFDSIDYFDNGILDGAITVDETVHPEAALWFAADAATNRAVRP